MKIFAILISSIFCVPDIGIFNQWIYHNQPVIFGWDGETEESVQVQNYDPDYYQMKWACGAQLKNRMFVFGGETLSGGESKWGKCRQKNFRPKL